MTTDQNLLFGALALQLHFLDDAQFAGACTAWAAEPTRPLPDVLMARGWLTGERRRQVEQLLALRLAQQVAGMPVALGDAAYPSSSACLETLAPPNSMASAEPSPELHSQSSETILPVSSMERLETLPPPGSLGSGGWSPSG